MPMSNYDAELKKKKRISDYTNDLNSEKKWIINDLKRTRKESVGFEPHDSRSGDENRFFYRYYISETRITGNEKTIKRLKLETDDKEEFDKISEEVRQLYHNLNV
jgi:hypothetical protein